MGQLTRCQDGATSGPQRFLKPVVKVVLAWALAQRLGPNFSARSGYAADSRALILALLLVTISG